MVTEFNWPEPSWLVDITDEQEKECSRVRWLLSMACLYYSQDGRPGSLAEAIGLTPNAFSIIKSRGRISPDTVIAIGKELGRDLFPREVFRPDLFVIPE